MNKSEVASCGHTWLWFPHVLLPFQRKQNEKISRSEMYSLEAVRNLKWQTEKAEISWLTHQTVLKIWWHCWFLWLKRQQFSDMKLRSLIPLWIRKSELRHDRMKPGVWNVLVCWFELACPPLTSTPTKETPVSFICCEHTCPSASLQADCSSQPNKAMNNLINTFLAQHTQCLPMFPQAH